MSRIPGGCIAAIQRGVLNMSAPIRVLLLIVPAFLGCMAWAGAAENPGGAKQGVQAAPSEECLVTKNGVGRIELGMTLAEARARYPEGKFARTSDGEGLALVALSEGGEELMRLFANENDPVGAIDPARKIVFIETFSSRCRTREGIYPGLPVSGAEKIVGKTSLITVSEIESREFIQFARHPDGLTFRLDYSGIFPKGLSETTKEKRGRS